MKNEAGTFPAVRFTREGRGHADVAVAIEFPLTVILNDRELVTLLCSPANLKYLAVGFLLSEGLLRGKDDIRSVVVDDRSGVARVNTAHDLGESGELLFKRLITTGCGRGASFYSAADAESLAGVDADGEVSVVDAFDLARDFQHRSRLYPTTHGVHSAALCDGTSVSVFCDDVGRHNAIDKVFGGCCLEDIRTDGKTLITSGRVSSEIALKAARRNIPILISISAPTDAAVELADRLGITLVSSIRGRRMSVFTHDRRIVWDGGPSGRATDHGGESRAEADAEGRERRRERYRS